MSKIPLKIYQSWKTKDFNELSDNMLNAIKSITSLNPEYSYELFDDNDCRKFIYDKFGQIYADAFDDLIPGAFKSDFWRYAKLYHDGGVYMDIDFTEFVPLKDIIKKDDVLVSVADVKYIPNKPPCGIFQAFVACIPKHPVLLRTFEMTFYNIINHKNGLCKGNHDLDITGPIVMGRAMNIYWNKSSLLSIKPGRYYDKEYKGYITLFENKNAYVEDLDGRKLFKNKFDGYLDEHSQVVNRYSNMRNFFKSFGNEWDKVTERFEFPKDKKHKKVLIYVLVLSIFVIVLILIYINKMNKK
jgi:preprotein translocase subunit SecE